MASAGDDGQEAQIDRAPIIEVIPVDKAGSVSVDEALKRRMNEGLIDELRSDLGYIGVEAEWVELSMTLQRYLVRMGNYFLFFPVVLNQLSRLAEKGCRNHLVSFLELIDQMPLDVKNLEIFVSKLLTFNLGNPIKSPSAVLTTLHGIEPENWVEMIWYMDLIMKVDLTMAELTSMYVQHYRGKPPIYIYFLMQIARTGRLEAMDKLMELLPLLEKSGEDIGKEMQPIMDLISENRLAEAELTMIALLQAHSLVPIRSRYRITETMN